jgi:hypothetical protein
MSQTLKEARGAFETNKHITVVQSNIALFIKDLIDRSVIHDQSKLDSPEIEVFGEYTPELAKTEYGSPEYNELLAKVKPAIDHHYANNRHHPEHWPEGINDMTLMDLVEMLSDWKAATERIKNGNIRKSIEVNAKRYKISPQLQQILENTVREMFQE